LSFVFRRNRELPKGESPFEVRPDSVAVKSDSVEATIVNTKTNVEFTLVLNSLRANTLHLTVNEKTPISPRFVVKEALVDNIVPIEGYVCSIFRFHAEDIMQFFKYDCFCLSGSQWIRRTMRR
jgi:hypothetical protein